MLLFFGEEGGFAVKFIDDKGRVFGKISIVDLAVIFVVILGILWFGYSMWFKNLNKDVTSREKEIEITVLVQGIRPTTADAIKNSTKMFEFKTGAYIGDVVDVTTEPSKGWTVAPDGSWLQMPSPDKVDAYVRIRGTARIGEDVITMNGVEVRIGTSLGLKSQLVSFTGNITEMNLEPAGGAR